MKTFNFDQRVGQIVDHYRVEQFLSHGSTSTIYRAQQQRPNRPVALTVFHLPEELSDSTYQQFRTRFLRDTPVLVFLNHPNLLPLYGYGEWEGWPYLTLPYKTEGSLATLIKEQGPWSPTSIMPVLKQIVAGIEYAHYQGQVHGMLTPEYVLRNSDGSFQIAGVGLQQRLEKRGILPCQQPSEQLLSLAGTRLCAPKYLAPEYQQGYAANICTDVYSIGVILVELLCGCFLPSEISTQEIREQLERQDEWHLSTSLQTVIQCALAEDPKRRFPQVSDLLAAYAEQVEQKEVHESTPSYLFPGTSLPSSSSVIQKDAISTQIDEIWTSPFATPQWSSLPSLPPPLARTKGEASRPWPLGKIQRRQVTALLAGGLTLGIVGAYSINYALANKSAPAAAGIAGGIGQATQAVNSSQAFLDTQAPDHRQRLLIHLPDGKFVAYKQGCTHTGVLVNYDPKTHLLVCPAHGAIFDPAQGGRVVQGPTNIPLPQVAIQISSTGTITLA